MTAKVLESILKNSDSKLLTEEQKKEAEQLITEAINLKVEEKVKVIKESYEAKEKELKESYDDKQQELKETAEANERVLIEEAEKHKKELEQTVIEETQAYKTRVETELAEESEKYRSEVEAMVLEEAKELKARQDAALVEEVQKFRNELIDKVSDYIEAQLSESIPTELMEAAAKLDVYQPLVEAVQNAFSANYIKLDTTQYMLIKEARDEIKTLKDEIQSKAKEEIRLKKELKNVKINEKIKSLTEGLTAKQKGRAIKLLEGVSYEDLDTRFDKIRDIVIDEDTPKKEEKPVAKSKEVKKQALSESKNPVAKEKTDDEDDEIIKHQVKKVITETQIKEVIKESEKKDDVVPENANPKMTSWAQKLDKQRNRS